MGMNNNTLGIKYTSLLLTTVVAAGLGAGIAYIALKDKSRSGILLRATDQDIASGKWKDIYKILDNPVKRQKLYRIAEFNDGTLVGEKGEMDKELLLEDYDETVTELKTLPFTGHAFQIGVGAKESTQRIPNRPDMSHAHYRPNIKESIDMVKEVNNFLNQN